MCLAVTRFVVWLVAEIATDDAEDASAAMRCVRSSDAAESPLDQFVRLAFPSLVTCAIASESSWRVAPASDAASRLVAATTSVIVTVVSAVCAQSCALPLTVLPAAMTTRSVFGNATEPSRVSAAEFRTPRATVVAERTSPAVVWFAARPRVAAARRDARPTKSTTAAQPRDAFVAWLRAALL